MTMDTQTMEVLVLLVSLLATEAGADMLPIYFPANLAEAFSMGGNAHSARAESSTGAQDPFAAAKDTFSDMQAFSVDSEENSPEEELLVGGNVVRGQRKLDDSLPFDSEAEIRRNYAPQPEPAEKANLDRHSERTSTWAEPATSAPPFGRPRPNSRRTSRRGRGDANDDDHGHGYGTSWNNHYQAPTRSHSYGSRYDEPESGEGTRYGEYGQRQYNYRDQDDDSDNYHSETPDSDRYSGGSDSHGGNKYGGSRNHYASDGNHYGDDEDDYGRGEDGYDDGENDYGGRGEGHYGGDGNASDDRGDYHGGRDGYDGGHEYDGDDYGGKGGDHGYSGYDGDDYGGKGGDHGHSGYDGDDYGGRGGKHGHSGYDGDDYGGKGGDHGHGGYDGDDNDGRGGEHGHSGYDGDDYGGRGDECGHSGYDDRHGDSGRVLYGGHAEDPEDEYGVYSPKLSNRLSSFHDSDGTRAHRGSRDDNADPGDEFRPPFGRSDDSPTTFAGKRDLVFSDKSRIGEPSVVSLKDSADRDDDTNGFSGGRQHHAMMAMIRGKTMQAFGDGVPGDKGQDDGPRDDTGFEGFLLPGDAPDTRKKHVGDESPLGPASFGGSPESGGLFSEYDDVSGTDCRDESGEAPRDTSTSVDRRRPSFVFPDGVDIDGIDENHTDDGHEDRRRGQYRPLHGLHWNLRDHDQHRAGFDPTTATSYPSRYQEGATVARQANDVDSVMAHASETRHSRTKRDTHAIFSKFVVAPSLTRRGVPPTPRVHYTLSSPGQQGVHLTSKDLNTVAKFHEYQNVRPVIHRYHDGVSHEVHRHMGDEIHRKKGSKTKPSGSSAAPPPKRAPSQRPSFALLRRARFIRQLMGLGGSRTRQSRPTRYILPRRNHLEQLIAPVPQGRFRQRHIRTGQRALFPGPGRPPSPPSRTPFGTPRLQQTETGHPLLGEEVEMHDGPGPTESENALLGPRTLLTGAAPLKVHAPTPLQQGTAPAIDLQSGDRQLRRPQNVREVGLQDHGAEVEISLDGLDMVAAESFDSNQEDSRSEASNLVSLTRSTGFKPGVLHGDFVAMLTPHRISRRSVRSGATLPKPLLTLEAPLPSVPRPALPSWSDADAPQTRTAAAYRTASKPDGLPAASGPVHPSVVLSSLATASWLSNETDLTATSSRLRSTYRPYEQRGRSYGERQGYDNYERAPDPYDRYLPKEDENDPYLRYAAGDNIQHVRDEQDLSDVERETVRQRRHSEHGEHGQHGQHGEHGQHGTDRHRTPLRRPALRYGEDRRGYYSDDDEDYDSDYYDEYDSDDRHDNDYRDDDRRSKKRRNRNRDYDYEDDERPADWRYSGRQRYHDPADQSGRYTEDGADRQRYGNRGDERIKDMDDEIRGDASRGYHDSRRTVSSMLDAMQQKRHSDNCREVTKDDMTCLQCTDAGGMQTEDCAYASRDPNSHHVSYSESSRYGDDKRRGYNKRGRLHRGPSARQRDSSDIYNGDTGAAYNDDTSAPYDDDDGAVYDYDEDYDDDHDDVDSEEGGLAYGRTGWPFDAEDDRDSRRTRLNTPGAFKAGRFRDSYTGGFAARSKRHILRERARSATDPRSNEIWPPTNAGHRSNAVHSIGSYTDEARARYWDSDAPDDAESRRARKHQRYRAHHHNRQRHQPHHRWAVVPEYYRRVESSQVSGGGHQEYAASPGGGRPVPEGGYDDPEHGGYRLTDDRATIGDVFDYRFGKQPIDGGFVERLESEREERPLSEYEDEDYGSDDEYEEDYEESGARTYPAYDEEDEEEEPTSRSRSSDDTRKATRYSDYEDNREDLDEPTPRNELRSSRNERGGGDEPAENERSFDRVESANHGLEDAYRAPGGSSRHAERPATFGEFVRGFRPFANKDDVGQRSSASTRASEAEDARDSRRQGRHAADDADNIGDAERHERRHADRVDNVSDEPAADFEPLDAAAGAAAYERHGYDQPDATRSYEVAALRRATLSAAPRVPRAALHSDAEVEASLVPGLSAAPPAAADDWFAAPETRFGRPETFDRLNRGSEMTRRYRDPGLRFFSEHPAGFEHFPTFDYVEGGDGSH